MAICDEKEYLFKKLHKILLKEGNVQVYKTDLSTQLSFTRLRIDIENHHIYLDEKIVHLTNLQFRILLYLAKKPGRVFTYKQLYEAVWNEEYFYEKGNFMSQIRHIRKKIEPDSSYPHYIENIREVGYRFNSKLSKDEIQES